MADFTSYRPSTVKISFSGSKYHVFLSLRGPDVRKSLVDHLFQALTAAGIHVFLDSESLQKGEIIGSSLEMAIENSAIFIPIFSRGYADSAWCLEEARQMWKWRSTRLIIPLFYDVDPSDVRHPEKENGRYAEAFKKHFSKGRHDSDIIHEWKDALHYISSLSGWTLCMVDGYEGRLVRRVVMDVINSMNNVPRHVARYPVGLAHHISKAMDLLAGNFSEGVITMGIWGIGGIGKSTLAKALFNHLCSCFETSCFLSDVSSSAQEPGGLIQLQKKLLNDLSKVDIPVSDIDHGKSLMQIHLGSRRSLIIVDNIDHSRQLDSFMLDCCAPGSLIIVTTRDSHVLRVGRIKIIYKLDGLKEDEALELFSWHAFMRGYPDNAYQELSKKIVNASGGVPLTLEVLGAFLSDKKSGKCWIEALRRLESIAYKEIFKPLKISYDALLPSEREIFLDIACIFTGQDIEEPTIFWEELWPDVNLALANLQDKLLINIDNDNKVTMHDLLRDLGRAIVVAESRENPGKRSRLWKQGDVHKVINEKQGTESVKYLLHVQESEQTRLKIRSLALMNRLQYLSLSHTIMEGDMSKLSPTLKWVKWNGCPLQALPPWWNLEHLAILELSSRSISHGVELDFSIKQLWDGQSHRKVPKNLRVLRVNWCPVLQRLPNLSTNTSLLKLDLTGCKMLRELPESLGLLRQLNYLELSGCSGLEKIPECIAHLVKLKHLGLAECSSLRALPYFLGCLQALNYLNLFKCKKLRHLPASITEIYSLKKVVLSDCSNLRKLPDTLEGFKSLKVLELKDVYLRDLPHSIGELSLLETLEINSPPMERLPTSVGNLKHLHYLNISDCRLLYDLPDEIGDLSLLEVLLLNGCLNLHQLPECFGRLVNLKILEMNHCSKLEKLPSTFFKLRSLVRFEAGYCNIWSISENFGDLSSLKILHLEHNKFVTLPSSCALCFQLTHLHLRDCMALIELPPLPKGLVELDIEGCIRLKAIPKVAHLKQLVKLRMERCSGTVQGKMLYSVKQLKSLHFIHFSGGQLRLTGAGLQDDQVTNSPFRVKEAYLSENWKERMAKMILQHFPSIYEEWRRLLCYMDERCKSNKKVIHQTRDIILHNLHEIGNQLEYQKVPSFLGTRQIGIVYGDIQCGVRFLVRDSGNCTQVIQNLAEALKLWECFLLEIPPLGVDSHKRQMEVVSHIDGINRFLQQAIDHLQKRERVIGLNRISHLLRDAVNRLEPQISQIVTANLFECQRPQICDTVLQNLCRFVMQLEEIVTSPDLPQLQLANISKVKQRRKAVKAPLRRRPEADEYFLNMERTPKAIRRHVLPQEVEEPEFRELCCISEMQDDVLDFEDDAVTEEDILFKTLSLGTFNGFLGTLLHLKEDNECNSISHSEEDMAFQDLPAFPFPNRGNEGEIPDKRNENEGEREIEEWASMEEARLPIFEAAKQMHLQRISTYMQWKALFHFSNEEWEKLIELEARTQIAVQKLLRIPQTT